MHDILDFFKCQLKDIYDIRPYRLFEGALTFCHSNL